MGSRSTDNLVAALKEAGAPADLVIRATGDAFHDFKSESATPIVDLVRACERVGLSDIAARARQGEFDATREEAEAWAESPEGRAALAGMKPPRK
jgi:hypothetical protein